MSKAQHLKTRKSEAVTKALPLNFLLGCPKADLDGFELSRLAEVSDLRKELHDVLDRAIDAMTQAAMASWFKEQDRESLKHALESEESALEWAKRQIRNRGRSKQEAEGYGKMPTPSMFLPAMPPGAAHLAAALRYQERNMAEGKCAVCPKPLSRDSVRFCDTHLEMARERQRKKKAAKTGKWQVRGRGKAPGTLKALAEARRDLALPRSKARMGFEPMKCLR